jgi:choline dehydrogenase-like flavoprotein
MFVDGRQVETGKCIETDICVVGGGAAGITLARELAGSGLDIALIESGGLDFDWGPQDLYRGDNIGLPYFALDMCQLRYFGGNTNAWGGWCRPLDAGDFEPRPWIGSKGWPFPRAALEPHYRRAHEVLQLPETHYEPERWIARLDRKHARLLPFDRDLVETTIYQFSPPTRFGIVYREAIRNAGNIRCFLNTNALKIRTTSGGERATEIVAAARPGAAFTIHATIFVLTAGGTGTPRLLLLSDEVRPNGIGNGEDLVGRYFMEHPHTQRRILPFARRAALAFYGLGLHKQRVSARFALPWPLQQREGLLNYSGNIHPLYHGHDSRGWMALRKLVLQFSASRRTDPYLRFPPYGKKEFRVGDLFRILRELDRTTMAGFLQLLQPDRFIKGYVLESKSEQAPNPASRILLDEARDAFGQRRIRLDWRMLPIDRHTVLRGEAILDAELRRLGIGRLAPLPPELDAAWPENLEGGWHQLGMTRMDPDPRHGVVDADCRLHEVKNLYIASGSVFPTSGAAPPTLTIIALALRLAGHLREVMGEPFRGIERATPAEPAAEALVMARNKEAFPTPGQRPAAAV